MSDYEEHVIRNQEPVVSGTTEAFGTMCSG